MFPEVFNRALTAADYTGNSKKENILRFGLKLTNALLVCLFKFNVFILVCLE